MPQAHAQPASKPTTYQGIAGDVLIQYFERIERLEEEKAGIAEDVKAVFLDAKSNGFDVKIMREILKMRKMEREALEEQENMVDLYRQAIGMH
ncbi:MAG: DUF2312 domain-containing protein [Magnetococcales bacterium]|nr:DUF2312 domain-containing protein [Magnetococcales bacterium]NGZ06616.1 DUF2312 domain-containing protein [Magnetococcales bacterium]